MYISKYLKMRIALARKLDELYFEPENANRCHKRIYELYACFFLGVNYDTYLSYLNPKKYHLTDTKLPEYIIKALKELGTYRAEEIPQGHRRSRSHAQSHVGLTNQEMSAPISNQAIQTGSARLQVENQNARDSAKQSSALSPTKTEVYSATQATQ